MKQLFVRHTYWTLNFQDGLAEETKFKTKEDAEKARKRYPDKGRGVCVMQRTEDKPLEDHLL